MSKQSKYKRECKYKGNIGNYKGLKNAKGQSLDGYKGPDDCKVSNVSK